MNELPQWITIKSMESLIVFDLTNILCFVLTPLIPEDARQFDDIIHQYCLKLKYKSGIEICYADLYFDKETYEKIIKDIEEQIYL